jgi:hypothetical protein
MRHQLICSLLRLGCPARRDRCETLIDQSISESMTMDGLSGMLESFFDGF